jgi:hypothetical protein
MRQELPLANSADYFLQKKRKKKKKRNKYYKSNTAIHPDKKSVCFLFSRMEDKRLRLRMPMSIRLQTNAAFRVS